VDVKKMQCAMVLTKLALDGTYRSKGAVSRGRATKGRCAGFEKA
jgi:hypothetical protein